MAVIKWENSRRGKLTSAGGVEIKIHIRKPFTSALTYGVYLEDNKVPTYSLTTIEEARTTIEAHFEGVK